MSTSDDDTAHPTKVVVTVLFFASARDAVGGMSQTSVELTSHAKATTAGLRQHLASAYPKLAPLVLDEDNLTLALNEEYVESGHVLPLKTGDTVALIPPISGG